MFLQAYVILLTAGGGTSHPPEQTPPWSRHPPRADTPPGADPSPPGEHAVRYGQRAGGTHPTGMQSCYSILFLIIMTDKDQNFFLIS